MSSEGRPVELAQLSKHFGAVAAVDDVSLVVPPGRVTGFLGPNGAGKTTTMRCLLGLVSPTSGSATFGGTPYRDLERPLEVVGAALEASSFHPGRTARSHLRAMALAASLPVARADEVLDMMAMAEHAERRVGTYSLGMRQRLALAQAMLGDPAVLVLDEPANGLDPAGIAWLRSYLRGLAGEGRTVLVSSHVLSEVQQTVDDVVVLVHGRLVAHDRLSVLESGSAAVVVGSPTPDELLAALRGWPAEAVGAGRFRLPGRTAAEVGHRAFQEGVELNELTSEAGDLESLFLALTSDTVQEQP